MAPRAPETMDAFVERLQRAAERGVRQVPFGEHHWSHVACEEDGVWRLRQWVLDEKKAEEHRRTHGRFMPEDAEMLSEPGPAVLLEEATLPDFIVRLRKHWPL